MLAALYNTSKSSRCGANGRKLESATVMTLEDRNGRKWLSALLKS